MKKLIRPSSGAARPAWCLAAALGALLAQSPLLQAEDLYWVPPSGNFNAAGNGGSWAYYAGGFYYNATAPTSSDNLYFGWLQSPATVNVTPGAVGRAAMVTDGVVTFNLQGNALNLSQPLYIGDGYAGTLSANTGTINALGLWVANGSAAGTFNLTNATLNTTAYSEIGYPGNGTVNLGSGAVWNSAGTIYVGDANGTGALNLTSSSARLNAAALVFGYNAGVGSLTVSSGAVVSAGYFERSSSQPSTINLNGGTLHATETTLSFFRNFGVGGVTIGAAGGVIDTDDHSVMTIAPIGGSGVLGKQGTGILFLSGSNSYTGGTSVHSGTLAIANGGSVNHASGTLSVGRNAGETGSVYISQGSVFSGITNIAEGSGSYGSINVSSSTLSSANYLRVGYRGTGSLNVTDLGRVIASNGVYIGDSAGGNGTVMVAGGTINSSAEFSVGANSTGSFTLSRGYVSDTIGYVGRSAGSSGNAVVSGGTWNNSDQLVVGNTGTGSLTISGGYVTNTVGRIAHDAGSVGNVWVQGGTWNNSSTIQIAKFGVGTLQIFHGVVTTALDVDLGEQASSRGALFISAGSLSASRNLTVGYSGSGIMTVSGGLVSVTGSTTLAHDASGRASMELSGGTLSTRRVVEGSGSGTMTFNGGVLQARANEADFISAFEAGDVTIKSGGAKIDSNGYTIGIGTVLGGSGALTKQGAGMLTLSGSNTYSGGTVVKSGTLAVAHEKALGTGSVQVDEGGTLTILSGMNPANPITLTGGTFSRRFAAGTNLAGLIRATSSLAGGQADTAVDILSGMSSKSGDVVATFTGSSAATNDALRSSDVLHLSGIPVVSGQTSDLFVLELSLAEVEPGSYLGWLNGSNEWVNAAMGNTGNNADLNTQTNYAGSFGDFQAEFGTDLADYVGAWGFTNTSVWTVLNHNSDFAVVSTVPEPTIGFLAALGVGALFLRRRLRNS